MVVRVNGGSFRQGAAPAETCAEQLSQRACSSGLPADRISRAASVTSDSTGQTLQLSGKKYWATFQLNSFQESFFAENLQKRRGKWLVFEKNNGCKESPAKREMIKHDKEQNGKMWIWQWQRCCCLSLFRSYKCRLDRRCCRFTPNWQGQFGHASGHYGHSAGHICRGN